jgi:4-amino-4-deoxy-L-arabinose transferase-like glycosyltransferase
MRGTADDRVQDMTATQARRALLTRVVVPAAIVILTIFLGLTYVSKPAWVFDEVYYYTGATSIGAWFRAPVFDKAIMDRVFFESFVHPPLPLYAIIGTEALFQGQEGDFLIAARMASIIELAALALMVYLFVKREAGFTAACVGAAIAILSPRLFANALFATCDVPLAFLWTATTIAFYRGMTSRRWAIASGLIFGLALLTKENALLMPFALWPWGIFFYRRASARAIVSMAVAGPLIFYAGWPWLWQHPIANFARFVVDKFLAGHAPHFLMAIAGTSGWTWRGAIKTLYFGAISPNGPAWHYAFVMTLITMPLAALVGLVASATGTSRDKAGKPLMALLWWSILMQLLIFSFATRSYDGVRLFLPVLALTAIVAGIGLGRIATRGRLALAVVVVLMILSPGIEFFIYQPYGLSYYSPLVGGLPGAKKLGMEAAFYGEAIDAGGFAAINERATPGQSVALAPMFRNLPLHMPGVYIRYTFLKPGLLPAAPTGNWDYLIFVNRGGSIEPQDQDILARGTVIHENRLLGVLLSEVLEKRRDIRVESANASGQR